MTTNFSSTQTAENKEMRLFSSEIISALVGLTVTEAKAANNLVYVNKSKEESVHNGLYIKFSDGSDLGLFRWDIVQPKLDYSTGEPKPIVLDDVLHKTARENLKRGVQELDWFEKIANAINGKTVGYTSFIGRSAKGNEFHDVVMTIG